MSRLDEIKARADAATPGPWSAKGGFTSDPMIEVYGQTVFINPDLDGDPIQPEVWADAEFIAAAREDVPWLIERIGELNGAICWDTTCLNCSSLLDSNYDQYMRAEKAEVEVERLTAERDALAAQVARVEALAGQWERLATTAINPDSREWLQACAATLRECLSGWQKMHAALAGSEADTSDTQPTDQEAE